MSVNLFDANFYRTVNSDLANYNDAQAWSHFQTYGLNEGRAFSPFVNLNFYRSSNSDLASFNNRQAFDHLQNYGVAEGRQFSPLVDLKFYRANNSDLAKLNNEQIFEHLRKNGVQEGRRFSPFVDLNIYSAANPDLVAAGLNKKQLLDHLANYGVAEGRRFSVSFDNNYYRSANSDLARAGLTNKQLIEHFELYGLREGRASSESFHVSYYLANNSDLKALGFNNLQAQQHFEVNGYREGRLAAFSDLTVSTDPGNVQNTAFSLGVLSRSRSVRELVSSSDRNDFYRFTVGQSGIFSANLTGLTGDADIRLIQDLNNNSAIDQGEVQAWQWERGTQSESIRRFLTAGTYFLQVMSYNNQTANYNITTNFTAAASDDRQFSIQVNFSMGSEDFSDAMKNAVQEAARFWENVIPYSSSGNHTLTIDVGGTDLGWNDNGGLLASAFPESVSPDTAGRWMPMSGIADININPDALISMSSNIDFFRRVVIHEFAHVLGIGNLWGSEYYSRNVVNFTTGTYNANTYAGWAYGEMRGTFVQTAIPLTTGAGDGSDYSHWKEEVFNNELMTHTADTQSSMPLSQMTIAALRDLGWNVNYGAAEAYSLVS